MLLCGLGQFGIRVAQGYGGGHDGVAFGGDAVQASAGYFLIQAVVAEHSQAMGDMIAAAALCPLW